jgi:hypothetical protein
MTSTVPSTTLMAVWSSMAHAGPAKPAAHRSAAAIAFVGRSGCSTCGTIEKSTNSDVSVEDYAVAIADLREHGGHHRERIAVAW